MPTIKDLKFDNKNANRHTEKGLKLLDKSISKLGLGRSILIDKDNNIIAGNGVTEVAGQLGIDKVRIVETTGDEIIAVKRKDLSLDSPQGRALAIADNQTAKVGIEFDESVIEDLNFQYDIDLFTDWEIPKIEPLELEEPEEDNAYTNKVDTPIYEPKNEKPKLSELYNSEKYKQLISQIEGSNCDPGIKDFLKIAASRHIVFDYEKIADFYAHCDKDTQTEMENSALVIIDYNKAIELGFTKLKNDIQSQFEDEYPDE